MPTGIILVDDHTIFRQCMRALLERQDGMRVLGEAGDGRTAIDLVRRLEPDVVVMDVTIPGLNGIDATRCIRKERPRVKVIALSMHCHSGLVHEMLDAGASGYLLKECAFAELVQAIHAAVDKNQAYLSPAICRVVLDGYLRPPGHGGRSDVRSLTSREREVLQLIAEGRTSRQIARLLHVSTRTVENHRCHIMRKLDAHCLAEVVKYAVREGLTTP